MALIICGHPRSGTTLLLQLCKAHTQIALTGEFRSFSALGQPFPAYYAALRKDWYRRGLIRQSGRRSSLRSRLKSGLFLARFASLVYRSHEKVVRLEDVEYAMQRLFPRASIVGDKYPRYIFEMDTLASLPGLKRIAIYRDGRDVVSSYVRKMRTSWRKLPGARQGDPVEVGARHWVRSIDEMEKHEQALFTIRYESLVTQPDQELSRLSCWLGVPADSFDSRRIHDASIGNYQEGLTPQELDTVVRIAGPTLERLDYI